MIKELIILNVAIYFVIAFIWYLIFTYQFTFRMTINIGGETLQKDFKGFELAILCILWIIILPFSIKNLLKKKDKEE